MLNLLNALPGAIAQGLVWGLMALGVFITFKILDIADLTVDSTICTGASVCAMMIINGTNVWVAILCAFLVGLLCGAVTGCLHIFLGIPAILSGILTQMALWSVNLKIMGKANQALPSRQFKVLLSQINPPKAILVMLAVSVVLIALLYWFFGTEVGCAIRATGCNIKMARAQGINTGLTTILGLAISNGIVALAGAFLCQYQGFSDINMGRGAVVIGLAAVVIGDVVVRRISKNFAVRMIGVVIGSIIYFLVYQIIIFLGLDTNFLKLFSAVVVAVFLAVPYVKKQLSMRISAKKGVGINE